MQEDPLAVLHAEHEDPSAQTKAAWWALLTTAVVSLNSADLLDKARKGRDDVAAGKKLISEGIGGGSSDCGDASPNA